MCVDRLTLDQFRSAWRIGGLVAVDVTASGGRFFVEGPSRNGTTVTLSTAPDKSAREFRDPGKAIAVLHAMGVRSVVVNMADWVPELADQGSGRRADRSERQRRAHEAAIHDAWFRAEVVQSLREAVDPRAEWITNEEAERHSEALLASFPPGIDTARRPDCRFYGSRRPAGPALSGSTVSRETLCGRRARRMRRSTGAYVR